jgi:uridine kinase
MESKLVLIAGGSGSGKSTLAQNLREKYPYTFALMHLDDYYRHASRTPKLSSGAVNWEHPDALDFSRLAYDVTALVKGTPAMIHTKSEFYNPGYLPTLHNKIWQRVEPRPIVIVEGYLALYDPALQRMSDLSVYLEMPIEDSFLRRSENKLSQAESYVRNVLIPSHYEFVEKTKKHADVTINVEPLSRSEVLTFMEQLLHSSFADCF